MPHVATSLFRHLFTFAGALVAALQPTLPYIGICTLAIFYDCYTAWQLDRRVKQAYPDHAKGEAGKFKSHHFGSVIMTLLKSYALIVLAFLIERHITQGAVGVDLTKVAAGAICFWQIWSIVENESSCNGARWAQVARRFFVDKTKRHLDLDLEEPAPTERNAKL